MDAQIAQKALDYLQNDDEFALKRLPIVVQQALRHEKTSSFLVGGLMLSLLIIGVRVVYYYWCYPTLNQYGSRELDSILGIIVPSIASVFFFVQLCSAVDSLVKMYTAPKYFIMRLVQRMKG
jgi:hypothetical protein